MKKTTNQTNESGVKNTSFGGLSVTSDSDEGEVQDDSDSDNSDSDDSDSDSDEDEVLEISDEIFKDNDYIKVWNRRKLKIPVADEGLE